MSKTASPGQEAPSFTSLAPRPSSCRERSSPKSSASGFNDSIGHPHRAKSCRAVARRKESCDSVGAGHVRSAIAAGISVQERRGLDGLEALAKRAGRSGKEAMVGRIGAADRIDEQ